MRFAGVMIERDSPCRLRDGIVLYADIYRPEGVEDPLPVLLMRQPYGKAIASTVTYAHPSWYAKQGFVVVIQDVRGRGASQGQFVPFVQEVEDGYDAVQWAASLCGTNGKVGMYGFSYQGATQWAAAAAHPPSLTAIAPAMCAADLYHGWFYPRGRFAVGSQLPWAAQLARDEVRRRGDLSKQAMADMEEELSRIMQNPGEWIRHLPLNDIAPLKSLAPYYQEWVEHHSYDDYWTSRNWLPELMEDCPPALHIGGWFDSFLDGTSQSFAALESVESSSRGSHALVIGPWAHIPWGRFAGGRDQGVLSHQPMDILSVNWFNRWLKGIDVVTDDALGRVRYFELGSQVWRKLPGWPPSTVNDGMDGSSGTALDWALRATQAPANGASGGGLLLRAEHSRAGVTGKGSDVFVYDARLPMSCDSYLPIDRTAYQERQEILVYTSPPLEEAFSICGRPWATLWVEALDGPTDLVLILSLVSDEGGFTFLSIGRELITYNLGCTELRENNLGAGDAGGDTAGPVTVTMRPIATACKKGDRLRLEVTGSAFPLIARHPSGMDENEIPSAGMSHLSIATVALYHGEDNGSFLHLPLVDRHEAAHDVENAHIM